MEFEKKREIMRAAVKAAQAHGFDLKQRAWFHQGIHSHPDFNEKMTEDQIVDMILINKFEKLFIFDLDFAKALFEGPTVCIDCECVTSINYNTGLSICCNAITFEYSYEEYLLDMVLKENPLEVIDEYLKQREE